ncbi:MAG: TetR/AcrR family transcriptional regulator [Rhizomicrobium sp.]
MPRSLSEKEVTDFRTRICDTASRLFAEKGAAGITMRELAAALKVSAMTPYRYFHDKDEILAELRAQAFERFITAINQARSDSNDLLQNAFAMRDAYVRFALADPGSYRLMFDLTQPEIEKYPALQSAITQANIVLSGHIHDLVNAGYLKGDPEIIGRTLWALTHGIVCLELAGKLAPEMPVERLVQEASDALCRGFGLHSPAT